MTDGQRTDIIIDACSSVAAVVVRRREEHHSAQGRLHRRHPNHVREVLDGVDHQPEVG